ncbi:uncharacterized protein LOC119683318 [Teleopsis dalmanni]|uniref:uncharacterized protein LOC119683318 n=1 Tax=Teleopsis dalmanni TaxID=139649 RepID=UPI0018CCEC9C|nr:uncharacterized protein LOC119683318 [Teleopsis dalmanni]
MVGPLMQGMVLLGIIYWYSKGMLSIINDYYRTEIQRKLKTENGQNDTIYNVDDLFNNLKTEENLVKYEEKVDSNFKDFVDIYKLEVNTTYLGICYKPNNLIIFNKIINNLNKCVRSEMMYNNRSTHVAKQYLRINNFN